MNQSTHLSDLRLDQLLAGELDPPSEAAMRAHLVACVPCTHRHGTLLAGAAQIRSDPRFAAQGPAIRERLATVGTLSERAQRGGDPGPPRCSRRAPSPRRSSCWCGGPTRLSASESRQ